MQSFLQRYNLTLTKQQISAVQAIEGPTLLLAVPGSGKTTTLVARLGYMIYEKNIEPENILVLTYTVAATKDMSERFVKVFGDKYKERLEFRTINGVCSKIISYYGRKIGQKPFELESDEKKKNARIASIYQKVENDYPTEGEIRDVSTAFTYIKNMMLTPEQIQKKSNELDFDLEKIYNMYIKSMQQENLMDYDDQMRYAYNILKSSPETLEYFQNQYKYICVDEAQDTSKIQHVIIALLANKYDNLFMVGDEDQSIYGFRAAYPDALLDFEKEHEGARILVMEENFRSNAKIVNAADSFIQKNFFRHKKNMKPHRDEGSDIKLKELPSRAAQYEYLTKKLSNTKTETAVLYKNNDSVIPLVDRLDRAGIPYRIKNAELLFFTNRIVTDILDIIRFSQNPYDTELFMKIYYKMNLYLTKTEAVKICNTSKKNNIPVTLACQRVTFENAFKYEKLNDFAYDIKSLAELKPYTLISRIVEMTGYKDYLERNHIKDSKSYILKEIARNCTDIKEFFERFNYLQDIIRNNDYTNDSNIILSTIHSSKGLEYDTVYMLDVIDGIIPEKKPDLGAGKEERMVYEEERRMYYVGITRAKNNLILFDTGMNSSFIEETVRKFKPSVDPKSLFGKEKVNKTAPRMSYTEYCRKINVGMTVVHKVFGKGRVTSIKIPYITIEFQDKEKTLSIKTLYDKNLLSFPE